MVSKIWWFISTRKITFPEGIAGWKFDFFLGGGGKSPYFLIILTINVFYSEEYMIIKSTSISIISRLLENNNVVIVWFSKSFFLFSFINFNHRQLNWFLWYIEMINDNFLYWLNHSFHIVCPYCLFHTFGMKNPGISEEMKFLSIYSPGDMTFCSPRHVIF